MGYARDFQHMDCLRALVGNLSPEALADHRVRAEWADTLRADIFEAVEIFVAAGMPVETAVPEEHRSAGLAFSHSQMLDIMDSIIGPSDAPAADKSMPALAWTSRQGKAASTKALLSLGADPNRVFLVEGEPKTAAALAIQFGRAECLEALLDAGADPKGPPGHGGLAQWIFAGNVRPWDLAKFLGMLESAGAELATGDEGRRTLARAVELDLREAVDWLCERGVDPRHPIPGERGASEIAEGLPREGSPTGSSLLIQALSLSLDEREGIARGTAQGAAPAQPRSRM